MKIHKEGTPNPDNDNYEYPFSEDTGPLAVPETSVV